MLTRRINMIKPLMARNVLGAITGSGVGVTGGEKRDVAKVAAYSTAKQYAQLPKLPVPDAKTTLTHFLEFARPLQSRMEFEETRNVVQAFSDNELPQLQRLLEKRAASMNNWLTPWWLNIAYLASRSPLPVVTSPGVLFPKFHYEGLEGQIDHAAKITQAALMFHQKIQRNELAQDMAGKVPFDMSQYKFLYGTTRIPKKGSDEVIYGCNNENQAKHITVMRNGHAFTVSVLDASDQYLSLSALRQLLFRVVDLSEKKTDHPLGIVSSDNRDRWAETYENLKKNPTNSSHLYSIEDSLFVVCLDQESEPPKDCTEKDEQARQSLHGCGSQSNSGNRWFDKTLQFIIGTNGYCGMTYEHTPAEGPPVASLMDFVCDQIEKNTFTETGSAVAGDVKRLDFELNEENKKRIAKSSKKMDEVVADIDLMTYTFKRYGKDFPKSVKISPDSFIQMAFQLAFYRIHGSVPPTYETATLRKFSEGRTENIRSPNSLAEAFVKKICSGRVPISELYDTLKAAADTHKKYTVSCMNGAGMDRHLLAWNLLAAEAGLPKPSILTTSVYQQMGHFQVSTSQVPTRHFIQMCFGPSAPDCYGICYNPQEKQLHFTVSTFKSEGSTSSKRFVKELEKALNDMNSVCSKALKEQSKL